MSDPETSNHQGNQPAARRSFGRWLATLPRWEQLLLLTAAVFVVGGGIWSLLQGDAAAPAAGGAPGDTDGQLAASFVADNEGGGTSGTGDVSEPASKGFFRLGFSFLAGFCIGAFVRATLKVAAIAFGFWLLMTFALAYLDIVVVDWQAMDSLWQRFFDNVQSEWGDFQRFMLGSLPATGLAVSGLAIGLRRH